MRTREMIREEIGYYRGFLDGVKRMAELSIFNLELELKDEVQKHGE